MIANRPIGIWIITGFALLVALNMASNIFAGLSGAMGQLNGVVQPNAFFGVSTAMLAAAAFWATATWRQQANAWLGGAGLLGLVLVVTVLTLTSPTVLLTPAYADALSIAYGRIASLAVGVACLTGWTWMLTARGEG